MVLIKINIQMWLSIYNFTIMHLVDAYIEQNCFLKTKAFNCP